MDNRLRVTMSQDKPSGIQAYVAKHLLMGTTRFAKILYGTEAFSPSPGSPNSLISKILLKGAVFVDGGANVGNMSRIASIAVGKGGEVHSFEPHPIIFNTLRNVVRNGGYSNVVANNVALSATKDRMNFYLADNNVSSSLSRDYLTENGLSNKGETVVETIPLDAYFNHAARLPDLIKFDLEGHELPALHGTREIIEAARPVFICEASPVAPVHEMIDFMLVRGYRAFAVARTLGPIQNPDAYIPNVHKDIVFVHPLSTLGARVGV